VEAAACGLPVVASPSGGPKEILDHCNNGLLVDVDSPVAIADALKKIIADQALWEKYSGNGIVATNHLYSWEAHSNRYLEIIDNLFHRKETSGFSTRTSYGKKLAKAGLFIISDLDGTLVDGKKVDGLTELKQWITDHKSEVVFGVASGRNIEIAAQAFAKYDLPKPDILICSAGSEIYYTDKFIADNGWESHIDYQWKRQELEAELTKFPGIRLQEEVAQWPFKLSYYVDDSFDGDDMANLYKFLDDRNLRAKILLTENKYLDFLPFRASKGNAVRYLSYKWKVPLENFITAGNSGNDKDMLMGKTRGIVVANYSPELEELRKNKFIYFSKYPLSKGVLEGIEFHLS
jgi:sucrose-phosphate synthase